MKATNTIKNALQETQKQAVSPAEHKDGYIKFRCEHTNAEWNSQELPITPDFLSRLQEVDAFRTKVFDQGFIGIYENGIGFGNLSFRWGNAFVITASATGGARELGINRYTLVSHVDIAKNTVQSLGPLPASSETMSHASVYQHSPRVNYVLHIHNIVLFNFLKEKNALSTREDIAYGTVQMAEEIGALAAQNPNEATIVMRGHEEGILIYGLSLAHIESQLIFLCQEAKEEKCKQCKKEHKEQGNKNG